MCVCDILWMFECPCAHIDVIIKWNVCVSLSIFSRLYTQTCTPPTPYELFQAINPILSYVFYIYIHMLLKPKPFRASLCEFINVLNIEMTTTGTLSFVNKFKIMHTQRDRYATMR